MKRASALLILLIITLLPFSTTLSAEEKTTVAVSELSAKGVSGMEASVVSDFLRDSLTNTGVFNIVERSSMEQLLAEQKFQMSGCTSDECAVKMGKMLNVQRMILGSLSKLGDMYYISVRMVDVERGAIISAETISANNLSEIQPACIELANRIATGKKGTPVPVQPAMVPITTGDKATGMLNIKSQPLGAEIIIDGRMMGTTPAELQLTAEDHKIELKKDNMYWSDSITMFANRIKNLNPKLNILPTTIEITSKVIGAKVYIDGKSKGHIPIKRQYEPGKYKLKVKKGGYKIYEDEIDVLPNRTNSFEISLEKVVKPPVKNHLGVGFFYPGLSLRWFTGVFAWELRSASADDINVGGIRLYMNFNPRSPVKIFMGFEGDSVNGKTELQKYTGGVGGAFMGMDIWPSKRFSFLMDIGMYHINLLSEYEGIKAENNYLVGNVGFVFYFL